MDDEELLRRFESGTLAAEGFDHARHVRLAWLCLRRYAVLDAIDLFCRGLKRFATAQGAADRYHETITWAYLLLIRERMERAGRDKCWEVFAEANPDLLDRGQGVLRTYYLADTLASELARRTFLLPDRLASEP